MSNFADLFERAKVRLYFDDLKQEVVFISCNIEEPLTEKEKREIMNLSYGLGIRKCRFEIEKDRRLEENE